MALLLLGLLLLGRAPAPAAYPGRVPPGAPGYSLVLDFRQPLWDFHHTWDMGNCTALEWYVVGPLVLTVDRNACYPH